jgi:hypothetical protein
MATIRKVAAAGIMLLFVNSAFAMTEHVDPITNQSNYLAATGQCVNALNSCNNNAHNYCSEYNPFTLAACILLVQPGMYANCTDNYSMCMATAAKTYGVNPNNASPAS